MTRDRAKQALRTSRILVDKRPPAWCDICDIEGARSAAGKRWDTRTYRQGKKQGEMMINSRMRIFTILAIGAFVALAATRSARATKLVQVTLETDKAVYDIGEDVLITWTAHNVGDETIYADDSPYHWSSFGFGLWVFDNPAGLSRDELLAGPIITEWSGKLELEGDSLLPDELQVGTLNWAQVDRSDDLVGPGLYTLVADDWPYFWDTMADYSTAVTNITIVPEPATLSLLAGVGGTGFLLRWRRIR
jgi:hypothetical protein